MARTSPMMQQYFEIKKQHPGRDSVLPRRRLLRDVLRRCPDGLAGAGLTLTGKNCGRRSAPPCAACPSTPTKTYVARLIAKGYKVAICEQMEDPALAKGLVKRDIIRVVTPGTVIESSMLPRIKTTTWRAFSSSAPGPLAGGRLLCRRFHRRGLRHGAERGKDRRGHHHRAVPLHAQRDADVPAHARLQGVTTYIKQHTQRPGRTAGGCLLKDGRDGHRAWRISSAATGAKTSA